MEHGLPHGLAGDRASVDRRTADHFAPLHDGHTLTGFRALNGGALASGSRSYDDEVVFRHAPPLCNTVVPRRRLRRAHSPSSIHYDNVQCRTVFYNRNFPPMAIPSPALTLSPSPRAKMGSAALLGLTLFSVGHFFVDLYSSALGVFQPLLIQ